MSHIAYYRVSTNGQSIEAQKSALAHASKIERHFMDEGVSGSIPAADRPGFAAMLNYVREGETTIRALLKKGVTVEVNGLGSIGPGVGELIVAVLAQVADMERARIAERTANGRTLAKASLAATGLTHRGKVSLGRPAKADGPAVKAWRAENKASISAAAAHFGLSDSTVKRYCAA
jgi:putative DNA-invertase from lambdoid prophage Rac